MVTTTIIIDSEAGVYPRTIIMDEKSKKVLGHIDAKGGIRYIKIRAGVEREVYRSLLKRGNE